MISQELAELRRRVAGASLRSHGCGGMRVPVAVSCPRDFRPSISCETMIRHLVYMCRGPFTIFRGKEEGRKKSDNCHVVLACFLGIPLFLPCKQYGVLAGLCSACVIIAFGIARPSDLPFFEIRSISFL